VTTFSRLFISLASSSGKTISVSAPISYRENIFALVIIFKWRDEGLANILCDFVGCTIDNINSMSGEKPLYYFLLNYHAVCE